MSTIQFLLLFFSIEVFLFNHLLYRLKKKMSYLRDRMVQSKFDWTNLSYLNKKYYTIGRKNTIANYAVLYMIRMRTQTHKPLCKILFFIHKSACKIEITTKMFGVWKRQVKKRKLYSVFLPKSEIRNRKALQLIKSFVIWTVNQNILLRTI